MVIVNLMLRGSRGLSYKARHCTLTSWIPAHLQKLERQKHTQPVNYQQVPKRKVRQESGIRGLKRFVRPDLLVPLAFSAVSSPSTDLEAALQQEFISFRFRNGWALQPAAHLQTRLLVCSRASLNAWSGWACKICRTVLHWLILVRFKACFAERCPVLFVGNQFSGEVIASWWNAGLKFGWNLTIVWRLARWAKFTPDCWCTHLWLCPLLVDFSSPSEWKYFSSSSTDNSSNVIFATCRVAASDLLLVPGTLTSLPQVAHQSTSLLVQHCTLFCHPSQH